MKMNQVVLQLIKQLMETQILLEIMEHLHLICRRLKHRQHRMERLYAHQRLVALINRQIPVQLQVQQVLMQSNIQHKI